MNALLTSWFKRLRPIRTYVVESWFLQELVAYLNRGQNEDIVYVTGVELGTLRILSRICYMPLVVQSPVRATTTPQAAAQVLLSIVSRGNRAHCMCHSHPGQGVLGTTPSSVDRRYLHSIQKAGAEVIGIITTRDGHVRFWSVHMPFRVLVKGNNYRKVGLHVYRVAVPQRTMEGALLSDAEDQTAACT